MAVRVLLPLCLLACAEVPTGESTLLGDSASFEAGSPPRDALAPDRDAESPASDSAGLDGPVEDVDLDAEVEAGVDPDAGAGCPLGAPCNPIRIEALPFVDRRDTRDGPAMEIDAYACAPDTDESGPEFWYALQVEEPGILTVSVDDEPGDDVDVDVHVLEGRGAEACLARDNSMLGLRVEPGLYYVVADSWVNGAGEVLAGPYELRVDLRPLLGGLCETMASELRMFWGDCGPNAGCVERGGEIFLQTPVTGPVVKEAHLVTVGEDFPNDWPTSGRDGLERHYRLSEEATGYEMERREPWAPAGEGGSRWGQAAFSRPLPVLDEAWYVNMYWRDRPAPGTRMILTNPANGRTVVAAAGYETGPGANTAVGGASEEIHDWLESGHRSVLTMGFAVDQDLPLGPIECD